MVRSTSSVRQGLPLGILVVAALVILFGLAELVTAFTHSFFGLTTSEAALSTALSAALGACYFAGGLVLLTGRRWAAVLAVALLCVDVIGRIAMVVAGLYPLDSFRQTFAIVAGTTIAAFFAVYVGSRRKAFK